VPAQARIFDPATEMPPVFATAHMIAFVEWACVHALAPYLGPHQRSVGTKVEMTHIAATPIGMSISAQVELVEVDRARLRFRVGCRDEAEIIGEGHHERTIIDVDRFMSRLARKQPRA
jgi:fluoroacetyl-CoA thioesterase